jgi:predicted nucleic acid-binding protein
MADVPIDTNVILRHLVEDPKAIAPKFKGVYPFFEKIETGRLAVHLAELVLFQAYFVLTSFYKVPRPEAAAKLGALLAFRGIRMAEKDIAVACLKRLETENLDLVDAYLLAWVENKGAPGVYSFDSDFGTKAVELLPVK